MKAAAIGAAIARPTRAADRRRTTNKSTYAPAKTASAPTRFAEYLAAGMPVAVTPAVGDLELLVERHGVGVVLREEDDATLTLAAVRLRELAGDPDVRERCRRLAADRFDVRSGCARYAALYARLAAR